MSTCKVFSFGDNVRFLTCCNNFLIVSSLCNLIMIFFSLVFNGFLFGVLPLVSIDTDLDSDNPFVPVSADLTLFATNSKSRLFSLTFVDNWG